MIVRKNQLVICLLFIFFICFLARILPGARTIDDAYITYRYARNIITGNGFSYNPGERVLGTTTPLYTLLMAAIGSSNLYLFQNNSVNQFPETSLAINVLLDGVTCLMLVLIGKKANQLHVGLVTSLLWAIAPFSVTFSIGGMETSLYIALLCSGFYFYLDHKIRLCAFSLSLSLLTRPDALIFILPIFTHYFLELIQIKKISLKSNIFIPASFFAIPIFIWCSFSLIYFGSPIPHSIMAKSEAYLLNPQSAFIRFLQHFATPFMDHNWAGAIGIGIGLILYPFLYLLGASRSIRINKRFITWAIYPWFYLIIFSLANPLIFRWYLSPPLPPYFFFIISGLLNIGSQLIHFIQDRLRLDKLANLLFLPIIVYPFASTLSEWRLRTTDHGAIRPIPDMAYIELEEQYKQAAQFINTYTKGSSVSIAAGDIGVLGFYTRGRILDTVGLISPVTLHYYPLDPSVYAINYAIPSQLILDQLPDLVVFLEIYGRNTLLLEPKFLGKYNHIFTIESMMYGSKGLLIYAINPNKN